jgi:succinylarginine dihydrolase
MVARVAVAMVAVVVLGWLAVMERDDRKVASAVAAAQHGLDPRTFARADADLRAARLLNPDTQPQIDRALLRYSGHRGGAEAIVEDVLRGEPDNLTAWGVLYTIARGRNDPAAVRRSLAALRRLDPVTARRR